MHAKLTANSLDPASCRNQDASPTFRVSLLAAARTRAAAGSSTFSERSCKSLGGNRGLLHG